MYTVYAIFNSTADKIYIGQTVNLTQRLKQHNNRTFQGYTSRFLGEWELIYKESVATRPEAIAREKQLKSYRGREFIKSHIPT
jgi:putative endonuclease